MTKRQNEIVNHKNKEKLTLTSDKYKQNIAVFGLVVFLGFISNKA